MNTTHDFTNRYSTVISLAADQLHPVPEFCSSIGSVANRMLMLRDIEKLMTSAEMGLVARTLQ